MCLEFFYIFLGDRRDESIKVQLLREDHLVLELYQVRPTNLSLIMCSDFVNMSSDMTLTATSNLKINL